MASSSAAKNQKDAASVRQKATKWIANARKRVKSHRPAFLLQLIYWALVVIVFVVGAYFLFGWMMGPTGGEQPERIDITRMALTVAAGFGGLVALVVAYRKQRDAEEGRFVERFGAAAEQLGHTDVAVRMAGVYAMAGVADRTKHMEQRQQCVNVLCGYLRLPYDPDSVEDHQVLTIVRNPEHEGTNPSREIHFQYRQNDREVRNTIVRIIADHLRRDDSESWSQCSFDFSNVFFEEANFSKARFKGEYTSFGGATFGGVRTAFDGATFGGEIALFDGATFGGEATSFHKATFGSETTSFHKVTFGAAWTLFGGATFGGVKTLFGGATFGGEMTLFDGATFGGARTEFDGVTFGAAWTLFGGATFGAARTSFKSATFRGEKIDFEAPKQWSPAPEFDWDDPASGILKPDIVKPDDWPPMERL